jgi:tetratricopeptide (TPR) repeat protein
MLELSVSRGGEPLPGVKFAGCGPCVIGGAPGLDLTLPGGGVLAEHCRIERGASGWTVAAAPGARMAVNGQDTPLAPLRNGDVIAIGEYLLTASLAHDPPARRDAAPSDRTEFRPRPVFAGEGPNAAEVFEGPGQGTIMRFGARLSIGRSPGSDLVLADPSVSREHALIERSGQGYAVKALNDRNPVLQNGAPVKSAALKSGDVLTLGACKLRIAIMQSAPSFDHFARLTALTQNRKLMTGAGCALFALLLALFLFSGSGPGKDEELLNKTRQKEQAQFEAEAGRKTAALLAQAAQAMERGEFAQALARYQSVLEAAPGNAEALAGVGQARARQEERESAQREQDRMTAQKRERVTAFIQEADRHLAKGKFEDAAKAADKALKENPGDQEALSLLARVNAEAESARRQADDKTQSEKLRRERLRDLYAKADAHARAGELFPALRAYREASEEDADQARAADARAKIARLQDALVKQIMPDYNQGLRLYSQKKYAEAMASWQKVLAVYPEARETRARVAELKPVLEKEAKRLYEEGLVFEGLGNRDEARERFKAVLDVMPFEDNSYRQKALAKLGR